MGIIKIKSIGRVRNSPEDVSEILISPELSQCLAGIERYSHIVVLFWMHKVKRDKMAFSEGVLASRVPFRPNPIGLTIVELVKREGSVLTVRGLDAFDGSPIIDIKPYTGHPKDLILDFRSPDKF